MKGPNGVALDANCPSFGDFTQLLLVHTPGEPQLTICIVILCEQ